MAVSATTRARREGEQDGRDYRFLDPAEFESRVQAGEFAEHVTYAGNRYGTLLSEVEAPLAEGRSVVLEIELQGARAVRRALPDAVSVFIAPPTLDELGERLRRRATDTEDEIAQRLETGRIELAARGEFDYTIVNRDAGVAVDELVAVVQQATREASDG